MEAAPAASFAPSSSPATAATPSLRSSGPAGPQRRARLFPITRCSPRHRPPPPRGRRQGAGSDRPPRPWLDRPPPPASASPASALLCHRPLPVPGDFNSQPAERGVRRGDAGAARARPAGSCSARRLSRPPPPARPKVGGEEERRISRSVAEALARGARLPKRVW